MAQKEYTNRDRKKASLSKTDRRKQLSMKEQLSPLLKQRKSQEVSVIYPVKETNSGKETSKESIRHDGGREGGKSSEETTWEK